MKDMIIFSEKISVIFSIPPVKKKPVLGFQRATVCVVLGPVFYSIERKYRYKIE